MTTQTISAGRLDTRVSTTAAKLSTKPRLFFIDNLRIVLIALVILHHLAITYGAPGNWYYNEGQPDMVASIVLTLFVAVNQSFFMGFFFMIAGYFTPGSYDRKEGRMFLKDRLLRLGIPLLFYIIVIDPLLNYALRINGPGFEGSLWQFLARYLETQYLENFSLGSGPLWFVEALLIFALIYALWRRLVKPVATHPRRDSKTPGNLAIALFAFLLGVVTFILRIWLPFGWNFEPLNLQFPYFPQYIALFVVGLIAYRRNWFLGISEAASKLWLGIVIIFIVVLFPAMLVFGGALEGDIDSVRGGVHWQSLVFSIWEQFVCLGMVIALLVWSRKRFNYQSVLAKAMSASAYTVYIIHASVVVLVALALQDISLYPLIKFPLVALIVIPLCFLLGNFIRKLPLARDIL